ncbi:MAG: PEGA domain-containing protein, partial [Acidobacteriota bacterium]
IGSHGAHAGFHVGVGHRGYHRYGYHRYGYNRYGYHRYRPSYRYRGHFYRPFGYYRHYYPYIHSYGDYGYPRYSSRFYGGLDMNVKPKKTTQVYIDGNYVGTAGNFDGWPQHLWLEKDSYEVILYNPGYETVVRQVEIQPRVILDINEVMRPGESIPVEELTRATKKTHAAPPPAPSAPPAPRYSTPPSAPPAPPAPTAPAAPSAGVLDVRQQPARVRLTVEPADATVYLDGRFLGLAAEINERPDGMLVDPGEHILEIVRPGFETRKQGFKVEAGQEIQLRLRLETQVNKTGISA